MFRHSVLKIAAAAASAAALAAGLAACGSSGSSSSATGSTATGSNAAAASSVPTVTLMVGGIDKQIYLPYQLAQQLGFYKKYGVNVQLSTEQQGGVGAVQSQGIGTSVINLATTSGAQQWLGGAYPAAGVLARADWSPPTRPPCRR